MFNFEDRNPDSKAGGIFSDSHTDRENGEYHYKNGYTQKIYSDAHYVPENESTVPPRYYTPPEKTTKENRVMSEQTVKTIRMIMLCLMCALFGGVAGGAVINAQVSEKVRAMEESVSAMQEKLLSAETERAIAEAEAELESPLPPDSIYELACEQVVSISADSVPAVSGTGFAVTEDGYIVTCYHIVEGAQKHSYTVRVSTHEGDSYEAEIVGTDEKDDLAVLKIDAETTPAALGSSDELKVGDTVYAVGDPYSGLEFSMCRGFVSALERRIKPEGVQKALTVFQLDAALNFGNSGGPVYDDRGRVVGIVSAKYDDVSAEGICFAIPISDAYPRACDIISRGYVTERACMSLCVDTRYNSVHSQFYEMPMGAYVLSVEKDGCAAAAGIQPGDVITAVDGVKVAGNAELCSVLKRFSAGDSAQISVYRAGTEITLPIVLDGDAA